MKYLVCNLKATKIKDDIISYEKELQKIKTNPEVTLIVCPSTLFLYLFQGENYKLGTQDISRYNLGPHTGENTAEQLASLNVKYALVGHSERRKLFKEEENVIIDKIKKSYHNHIKPICFIGEKSTETNTTNDILEKQLTSIINEVPDYKREKMIIVYEPIWAIGSGDTPSNDDISSRAKIIKQVIKDKYNISLPVLYGGSVNELNINDLCEIKELDGFVIGESSQDIAELSRIYDKLSKNL